MEISKFKPSDCAAMVALFYETVHSVNAKDYSQEQLGVWAPISERDARVKEWGKSFAENLTYIAKMNGEIVGFSDLTQSGHLDRLYVHKDHQRKGIASALLDKLEWEAQERGILTIDTEASISARLFFECRGYEMICAQTVERNSVQLINYQMVKRLPA